MTVFTDPFLNVSGDCLRKNVWLLREQAQHGAKSLGWGDALRMPRAGMPTISSPCVTLESV